jgi:hypothetical protein
MAADKASKEDKKPPRNDAEEAAPLTEEQRIALLEKSVNTYKLVLLGFGLFLLIFVSVATTAFAVFVVKGSDSKKTLDNITLLQQQNEQLKLQWLEHDNKLLALDLQVPELKKQVANSSNASLNALLGEQEKQIQTFLAALRTAAFELAHMVPGSRAWLDIYGAQIDNAIEQSKLRQLKLEQLRAKDPAQQPAADPFFGD